MHQKHPVSRFSFHTNWMKNKKLEKWFVKTLETIFLSASHIHFDDITEISASSFKSKGMYLQVIYNFKLSMLWNLSNLY